MKRACKIAVGVLGIWTSACQHSSIAPSGSSGSSGASVASVAIVGPTELAPGQTGRFTAIATMSDHSTQDYTQKVRWGAFPREVLSIEPTTGEALANTSGDANVSADNASISANNVSFHARAAVLVVPQNTFRLTGQVRETGLVLQGATVTVVSGTGTGLSSITDYVGQYRLYGVAGALLIRVSKPGYVDLETPFVVAQNDVLNFLDARQTQALPAMAGSYTLTVEPDPGCPTTLPDPRTIPLPAEMHQPRSYTVQLTQEGAALHLVGSWPTFLPPSDHGEGRITPAGIEFNFGGDYIGYGPDYALTANISATQLLSYEGYVYATRLGSTVAGRLDGEIQLFERGTFYIFKGQCQAGNHRFSMSAITPTATSR